MRRAVQPHAAAENRRVGTQPSPEIVGEHDEGRPARPGFAPREAAAERGRDAEHVEEVRRHDHHANLAGIHTFTDRERRELAAHAGGVFDRSARLLQLRDIGAAQPAALHVDHRPVVAPDEVEILRMPVGHRVEQDLLHHRVDDGEGPETDGKRADNREHERRRAPEAARRHLDIAAPVAAPAPRDGGSRALAGSVSHRIDHRAHPDARQRDDAAASERVAGAVAIGFDERLTHAVAKVGGVETEQQPEPAFRYVQEAGGSFRPFPARPPTRAARISASRRRTSALATRRPSSVIR